MKFSKKRDEGTIGTGQSLANGRGGLFHNIVEYFSDAVRDQLFYNTRKRVLDYIGQRPHIRTAHVEMHVKKSGLTTYEFRYDLFYPDQQGTMMMNKGFFAANMSSAGYIPEYILDEVERNGSAEIDFSTEDLETLYKEKDIKVKGEANYNELLREIKDKSYRRIVMVDRVYYTRVQCYDADGKMSGIAHIAKLDNVPENVKSKLYPCGSCEVTL